MDFNYDNRAERIFAGSLDLKWHIVFGVTPAVDAQCFEHYFLCFEFNS